MNFEGDMEPYRIGYPRRTRRAARKRYGGNGGGLGRKTPDRWGRQWQCEARDGCRFARRAYTAKGTAHKMNRDYDAAVLGRLTLHQWRRSWQRKYRLSA